MGSSGSSMEPSATSATSSSRNLNKVQQQQQQQQQQQLQQQQQQQQQKHQMHASVRLPLSLSIIFGSFTLGFYVAIQGPTLMDLIDLLHVNNDIMSHSLAFGSLAYSVGGLLSGFLFNYVDRQMLIPAYYVVFGVANILTPYISNYYIFSVITVFKMMCAGGTDCGANVWILDMWPGKDAWLQALHFSFAVGCALGPLVVEPFLSAGDHKDDLGGISFDKGSVTINGENGESRIYIPYGVSGSLSLLASAWIVWLFFVERRHKRAEAARQLQLASGGAGGKQSPGEHILMSAVQHPAAIEAAHSSSAMGALNQGHGHSTVVSVPETIPEEMPLNPNALNNQQDFRTTATATTTTTTSAATTTQATTTTAITIESSGQQQQQASTTTPSRHSSSTSLNKQQDGVAAAAGGKQPAGKLSSSQQDLSGQIVLPNHHQVHNRQLTVISGKQSIQLADWDNIKFTSKAREQEAGRPPYYVMLAIALSAMCLSFYCGIEITSMNYLATFAVNIDLQLPKSTAALMSSALTISFAVGRLFGIWIAAYMRPHKLFYLCAAIMALGNVFILLFANTTEMYLWYSICLFGIGCGPMYASIVSFYDDKIAKVTNTVSGIFILGSMFNVALNTLIIGHRIIDNALILIVCNLIGAVLLLLLFGSLHLLTRVKKNNRKRKFKLAQARVLNAMKQQQEQQISLIESAAAPSAAVAQQQQQQQQADGVEQPTITKQSPSGRGEVEKSPPPPPQPTPPPQQATSSTS